MGIGVLAEENEKKQDNTMTNDNGDDHNYSIIVIIKKTFSVLFVN